MANEIIRPSALPVRTNPVPSEVVPSDNNVTVGGVSWEDGVNSAVPPASEFESVAGVINSKRMTPLTTKQAIDAQVPPKISSAIGALNLGSASQSQASDFATAAQGALADTAVQPSRTVSTGAGLTGGGTLATDQTIALNSASIASLAKADTSVQTVNGNSPDGSGNIVVDAEFLQDQDSVTTAMAESFAPSVTWVRTAGRASPGDGEGGLYVDVDNGSDDTFVSADSRTWYRAADAGYFEPRPVAAPGFVRNVGDWMRERRSLTDFAPGSTPSDWSPVVQTAVDEVLAAGGDLMIPSGLYNLDAPVVIDISGDAGVPTVSRKRINITGQGAGNTAFRLTQNGMNGFRFIGSRLTSGGHGYCEFSDFSFVGASPTPRTAIGMRVDEVAYGRYRNLSFHNLQTGAYLVGALSSVFDNLIFNESVKGVVSDESPMDPNANVWIGCQWRFCTTYAFDAFTTMSGTTFLMPRVEACGNQDNPASGGFNFRSNGGTGEVAANIFAGYFEGNAGGFDIQIAESASLRAVLNIYGGDFRRIRNDRYVTNNIKTAGDIDLNLHGAAFSSAGDYAPNASRPYLSLSSGTRLTDVGCRWDSGVGGPITGQSLPYAGIVNGSLGAGVTGVLPNGWTVSHDGTGVFRVTHNLGHTDYAVIATVNSGNNNAVRRVAKQNNYFQVVIRSEADAQADDNFSFQLSVLKPTS